MADASALGETQAAVDRGDGPGPARVGVLISGRGSNMQALVRASEDAGCPYRVVLVAADRPDAPGLAWARERGLPAIGFATPTMTTKAQYEEALGAALREHGVGLVALAGYMRLLSPGFVARWPGRILNVHPSLLPRHKGLHTHERALAAGDAHGGCSVHVVTAELDAGAVLGQARVPVLPGDTADALAARVLVEEHRLYPRVLSDYARAMSDPLSRVRAAALALPQTEEDGAGFSVAGEPFARVAGGTLHVRAADGWSEVPLGPDTDWPAAEDRIARGWELAAPAGLLEAGGR